MEQVLHHYNAVLTDDMQIDAYVLLKLIFSYFENGIIESQSGRYWYYRFDSKKICYFNTGNRWQNGRRIGRECRFAFAWRKFQNFCISIYLCRFEPVWFCVSLSLTSVYMADFLSSVMFECLVTSCHWSRSRLFAALENMVLIHTRPNFFSF